MNIRIKSEKDIENIRKGGQILAQFLAELKTIIKPGFNLLEIDKMAETHIKKNGGIPAFKGFKGFPASICASVNEDIIHGIPHDYSLKQGDILSVDIGIIYNGLFADTAFTYCIGEVEKSIFTLVNETQKALYLGIDKVRAGVRIGDISYAIQEHADKFKYGIVREYTGHGVGFELWEDPNIPNYGSKGLGPKLIENMVIAIEPMFNLGTEKVILKKDGWTVSTKDKKPSAHFEHTIWVKKDGFEILSSLNS